MFVGKREKGGFEGELDIVALNPVTRHLLHVECSLDADPWEKRALRFAAKFDGGRRCVPGLFNGLDVPGELDQVALLQIGGGGRWTIGGGRLIWVADFIAEVTHYLHGLRPDRSAIPSNLPSLRTLQLAAHFTRNRGCTGTLIPAEAGCSAALEAPMLEARASPASTPMER